MNLTGPSKIVVFHCGKFDFAELELDSPVHLIGPNNVGKTSLISLLQFLYLDDQRHMQFSRELAETRRYYFPEKYSYALFECLTPTGFQVVGVRGLGPVRQHEFERFVFTGRIEQEDFIDAVRQMREPEETEKRLALKGFKKMEPRHLRAALNGVGDSRDVYLGLVPARHGGAYERFRKVFGNILRLSHIRQEELKQLLLDIYGNDFQQREIDLARHYAAGFEKVKRDSHEVKELKELQVDIERLLQHLERRDRARDVIPALWEAIGRLFMSRKAGLDGEETALLDEQRALETEQADLKLSLDRTQSERQALAGKTAVLTERLDRLEVLRRKFDRFEPDWARQRQSTVRTRLEELVVKLHSAVAEPAEQVRRRLAQTETQRVEKQTQLDNLAQAAINRVRKVLTDREIADTFSILNPALLKLPVNGGKPGIAAADEKAAANALRDFLGRFQGRTFKVRGITIDLEAVRAPLLEEYGDPDRIRQDLEALERDAARYTDMLEAAQQADALRAEKTSLEREQAELIRELSEFTTFQNERVGEEAWKKDLDGLRAREGVLREQAESLERRRLELAEAEQRIKSVRQEIVRKRADLQNQMQALTKPSEALLVKALEDIPADWDDLCVRYRKIFAEEQGQADRVREILDIIDRRTYGRYTSTDESQTIEALKGQLESIPQRERAVEQLWKGIAVGIKKDLQSIGKDLETLKGLVGNLNRQLSAVSISNLSSLKLLIEEYPQWTKLIREVNVNDDLPLFGNPKAAEEAFQGIARLLADHPRVDLKDLFNLCFEVGTPDGKSYRHEHLDAIESNGTTMAIKVLINLVLLKGLLGGAEVQIPFYLDECSSLDQTNLAAIVGAARRMGFIAVLASPEAMDAADKLYFLEEQEGGRVVLDPKTSMVRIRRTGETEAAAHA
ncbi:MAG: hypothetical protein R6X19_04145 [Kiritimatiellia bacterium]